jgi:hypothetical protein
VLEEAVRVPEPRRPFQLRIRKRAPDRSFREIWSVAIDPASRFVDRPQLPPADVVDIDVHGEPAVKADLLILGDGYTASQMDAFEADARRAADALFSVEPFASRKRDFNVRAIKTPARQSGVSRPRAGVFRTTPLGARYNSFDSERYVLSLEDRAWRDVAAAAPYEFVLILVNDGKYGGGGIFNLYSTAAAGSAFAPYLVVHEFGHHFAGLGDEYYTSPVAYEESGGDRVEPWEANITALGDPARLKWRDLVDDDTPLPTPWDKAAYEKRSREFQSRRARLRTGARTRGAVPRGARSLHRDARRAGARRRGRCVRGRDVRVPGTLPTRGGLHHVHARRGRLLPGLPPRPDSDHRPLFEIDDRDDVPIVPRVSLLEGELYPRGESGPDLSPAGASGIAPGLFH